MALDPRSSTISDLVRRSARTHRAATALVFDDRTWTYAQLDAATSRVAAHLLSLGLRKGDRVAAFGKNSDAYVLAFLGCARAGLVHVPLNNQLTPTELDYLLAQSGASVVLVDPVLRGAGFVDLGATRAKGDYSYVFSGESGSLDHALATRSLAGKVSGMDVWNVNAEESSAYQYDAAYDGLYAPDQYRASDHNPAVVGIKG